MIPFSRGFHIKVTPNSSFLIVPPIDFVYAYVNMNPTFNVLFFLYVKNVYVNSIRLEFNALTMILSYA